MGCVYFVGTVNSTGAYHTDRQFDFFHSTNLHRRCLGTQQDIAADVESILFISCGMVLRNVQRFEVVVIFFYFRTFCYFVAHTHEDTADFICNDAHRMFMTFGSCSAGHGNVDFFFFQTMCHFCRCQTYFCFIQHFFQILTNIVCHLTDDGTFFCTEFAHFFQNGCQFTFFAKVFYFQIINVFHFFCFLESSHGFFLNGF